MKYRKTKILLANIGQHSSGKTIHFLNGVFNYVHIGWWFKKKGFKISEECNDRPDFYEHIAGVVKEPVSYLEFGVFRGASMRIWSGLIKNPNSTLAGFDSFEGLPEVWRMAADKKTMDVKGILPEINDFRIRFYKGWFEETLPGFLETFTPQDQLILHLDADLYSSTKYVMNELKPYMVPGTILIFDELFDRDHELKALDEFMEQHQLPLECVAVTRGLTQAAFRVLPATCELPESSHESKSRH